MYFSHLTPKTSLILAVSSHFTITPVLAKKQICSKWDIKGAFAPNLEPKWEKSLVKTSTIGYIDEPRCGCLHPREQLLIAASLVAEVE
jgi:hypothetical protein